MIITLSGTNRPGANTRIVAQSVFARMSKVVGEENSRFMDLASMKQEIFDPASYGQKPKWFIDEFQTPILEASGLVIVTPEYNGSFPGVLKYFIDMLKFPESLVGLPVTLIGVAAGQFGALRSVEQLEMILHYRKTHIFGERLFVPAIHQVLKPDGSLGDLDERLDSLLAGFADFSRAVKEKK
jgi:chromate reductase